MLATKNVHFSGFVAAWLTCLIPAIVRVFETHIAGTTPQEYTITGFVLIMNNKRS